MASKRFKQPIGIWVMNPDGKPELIREASVRVARAQRALRKASQKYGHKPFLARVSPSGTMGERISSTPIHTKNSGLHHGSVVAGVLVRSPKREVPVPAEPAWFIGDTDASD